MENTGKYQKQKITYFPKKVLLFALFLTGIAVFFGLMKFNQEQPPLNEKQKNEALENILGRDVREEKSIPQGEKAHQGKFFSLSYPAYAQVYERENKNITNNKRILEYFRLDSEKPKFRFVVMVEDQDVAVLDELSGVKARKQNKLYKEIPLTIDSSAGLLFVKEIDGVERSSLFLINGQSYSFSITGVDATELEKVYLEIMESVRFGG